MRREARVREAGGAAGQEGRGGGARRRGVPAGQAARGVPAGQAARRVGAPEVQQGWKAEKQESGKCLIIVHCRLIIEEG